MSATADLSPMELDSDPTEWDGGTPSSFGVTTGLVYPTTLALIEYDTTLRIIDRPTTLRIVV